MQDIEEKEQVKSPFSMRLTDEEEEKVIALMEQFGYTKRAHVFKRLLSTVKVRRASVKFIPPEEVAIDEEEDKVPA